MANASNGERDVGSRSSSSRSTPDWRRFFGAKDAGQVTRTLDPDLPLVEQCLSGLDAAWEELVRLHTRRVYSVCYRFTGTDSEAQDLTQEVFLRVFRTLKSFRRAKVRSVSG